MSCVMIVHMVKLLTNLGHSFPEKSADLISKYTFIVIPAGDVGISVVYFIQLQTWMKWAGLSIIFGSIFLVPIFRSIALTSGKLDLESETLEYSYTNGSTRVVDVENIQNISQLVVGPYTIIWIQYMGDNFSIFNSKKPHILSTSEEVRMEIQAIISQDYISH